MHIMSGHTAKLESLPMFQGVRTPNGEVGAVMHNKGIWTYVLRPDGSAESILRDTVVDVLASPWDVAIFGLQTLECEASKCKSSTP